MLKSRMNQKQPTESRRRTHHHRIKRLFSFIFRPVIRVTDQVQTYYSKQSLFKRTIVSVYKLKHIIIPVLLFALLASVSYFWMKSGNSATMIMSLNYEESAKGLNPNSTRFNIYEVKSKDTIEKMLDYFGIADDKVSVDAIADGISITPCNLKAFNATNYYITTSYSIKLTKPSSIKGVTAKEMLTYLNKAYKDKFYSSYTENRSILSFDINQFNESEYLTISDLFTLKAQQLSKYLSMRKKQSKTFAEESTGETFISLSEKIDDFCNYDIQRYRSYVLETGLSNNKVHFIRTLDYINLMSNIDYHKAVASFDVRYDGITLYDEAMISIVMIPTIDYERNTYYMSKTKTGMDTMAKQADDFLQTSQSIAKSMEINTDIINKLTDGKNESTAINKANQMIVDMQKKLTEISGQIELIDKEFITYETKDYITIKLDDLSLTDRLQIESLIIIVGGLFVMIFFLLWLRLKSTNRGVRK